MWSIHSTTGKKKSRSKASLWLKRGVGKLHLYWRGILLCTKLQCTRNYRAFYYCCDLVHTFADTCPVLLSGTEFQAAKNGSGYSMKNQDSLFYVLLHSRRFCYNEIIKILASVKDRDIPAWQTETPFLILWLIVLEKGKYTIGFKKKNFTVSKWVIYVNFFNNK